MDVNEGKAVLPLIWIPAMFYGIYNEVGRVVRGNDGKEFKGHLRSQIKKKRLDPTRIRTWNPVIHSQMPYPLCHRVFTERYDVCNRASLLLESEGCVFESRRGELFFFNPTTQE